MFDGCESFYDERHFNRLFNLERKRAQRSGTPFIFVLIHVTDLRNARTHDHLNDLKKALSSSFRETDFRGWYKRDSVIGIVFTELRSVGDETRAILFRKLLDALASRIVPDEIRKIYITFHTYPASRADAVSCGRFDLDRYPVPAKRIAGTSFSPLVRRLTKAVMGLATLMKFLLFFTHPRA